MNLTALDFLRDAASLPAPHIRRIRFALLEWLLTDPKFGAMSMTEDVEILEAITAAAELCRWGADDLDTRVQVFSRASTAEALWKRWTALGSSDGWPKEAIRNCAAARAAYYACYGSADTWLWVATAENLEEFAPASADKMAELMKQENQRA